MAASRAVEANIKALEKYMEAIHAEQIQQYDKLKNLLTEAATGQDVAKQIE